MPGGTNGISRLQSWETYPENLTYRGCDVYGYNFASYRHQIESDAERLFISDAESIAVKVVDFNTEGANSRCICEAWD
jgi:hypothetical protein